MRLRALAAAVLAAFAPLSILAASAPVHAGPLPTPGMIKDVVVQSDGKILVAFQTAATDRFTILRLGLDGALDPTFGGDGIVETVFAPHMTSIVGDLALQPDGRIVAAGHTMTDIHFSKFAVVRYRTDGSLDPTFSGDGKVVTDFITGNGWDPNVAVASDGSIIAAGSETSSAGVLVARYRGDGSPDTAFDVDGMATFDLPGTWEAAFDVAADASGNAVVVGRVHVPGSVPKQVIARVRPNGQLDSGFGSGGLVVWDAGHGGVQAARAVAIQSDGRIVVAGVAGYEQIVTLSRYLPSGQSDQSFGDAGHELTYSDGQSPGAAVGGDVALLPHGRIAVSSNAGWPTDVRLQVHTPNGELDPAFDNGDGKLDVDLSGADRQDRGLITVARDGKIIVAGNHNDDSNSLYGTLEVLAVPSLAPVGDVAVSVGATPNPASQGPVQFQVRVRNDGPMEATGVGLTFDASQATGPGVPSRGSCKSPQPRITTCTFGAIPPGAEVLVSIGTSVTGTEEGLFGTATITSTSHDPDPSDNSTTLEVIINPI